MENKVQEAQNQLLKGDKTLNQIREEFGLEPIDDEIADKHIVIA